MTTIDVEERLRRTYADVAARTTTAETGDAALVASLRGRRRSWLHPTIAAAAVVAFVVAGLVVLSGRPDDRRSDSGDLLHAVPTWIPRLGTVGSERPLRLIAIDTTATVDRLSWAASAGAITLRAERTAVVGRTGTRPAVRRAPDGSAIGSPLRWTEPTGLELEVAWTGDLPAGEVERFVRGIVLVTADQWHHLTKRGGFTVGDDSFATFRIGADPPFDVSLVGDLHTGMSLHVSNLGIPVAVIDTCRTSVNWATTEDGGETTGYVVFASATASSATVIADGIEHRIDMTPLGPAVPVSVGGLVLDRSISSDLPRCEVTP